METDQEKSKLELEKEALAHLSTARKWSMFLARLGFIFLAIMLILGAVTGTFLTVFRSGAEGIGLPGIMLIIVLIVLGIFYVMPVYYLYNFSKNLDVALKTLNKVRLHKAFRSLKYYFVYLGVFAIVMITIYVLIIGVGGALMAFLKIL
jgi:hypothetical protein